MKLYKHHAVDKYALSALARKEIWATNPIHFNDPFDCAASIIHIQSPAGRINIISNTPYGFWGSAGIIDGPLNDKQQKLIEQMGVYSLSKRKKNRLMWAHYADQFRGFCLEYTFDDKSLSDLVWIDYIAPDEKMTIACGDDEIALIKGAARQKACDWKYEKECRLVYESGDRYYTRPSDITGVIFGLRCELEDRKTIMKLLGPDARPKHLKMIPNCFGLQIVDGAHE